MNQNSLGGSFFPAIAGIFFFMKKAEREDVYVAEPICLGEPGGLTGVAKYLEQHKVVPKVTEAAAEIVEPVLRLTGVGKYVQQLDGAPISSVTKYALRMAIAEREAKKEAVQHRVTGVANYLKNQKELPKVSGVSKYLKRQEAMPAPSKVSKYITRQTFIEKQSHKIVHPVEPTRVAKYISQQAALPQMSKVAKYMVRLEQQAKTVKPVVPVELTGVAKYLQAQESLPQASRVSKYLARQAAASKQNPPETSVERYMRSQG